MMQAGKLRHRITIQRPVETQSITDGSLSVDWQDHATVWAEITHLSARDLIAAQAADSRVMARIKIRYRSDLSDKMRLFHAAKDNFYNIEGILDDPESGLEYIVMPVSLGVKYQEGEQAVPVSLTVPEIVGDVSPGQMIGADVGAWANNPTDYEYQWYVNDTPVSGEILNSWTVDAQIGDIVTVGVIGSNIAGSSQEIRSAGSQVVT